ncbi:MAG: hypothetical protein GY940_14160, partial [bacterium]|nr:hypothetical protein [bacterium]
NLTEILCGELSMLVREGESYRFLHQHFRDFFAAVYILHELDMGKSRGDTTVLRERRMDFHIRRLLGELEGEHRSKPYKSGKKWCIDIDRENRLHRALDGMRGEFGPGVGYGVWNIVEIWKEVRGELSGADLSGLDLSGVMLNGVCCSRFYPGGYLAACFDGARLHEGNLFFRGHTNWVFSAVYSGDGKKILSASNDQTIKEWDAETGECLHTCNRDEKPELNDYEPGENEDIKLRTYRNIFEFKGKELVNIPGLFFHGCGFKDPEKGSGLSPENLATIKQYGGRVKR